MLAARRQRRHLGTGYCLMNHDVNGKFHMRSMGGRVNVYGAGGEYRGGEVFNLARKYQTRAALLDTMKYSEGGTRWSNRPEPATASRVSHVIRRHTINNLTI